MQIGYGFYAGVPGWIAPYCAPDAWHVVMDPGDRPLVAGNWIGRVPGESDSWEHGFIARGAEGGRQYGQYCQRWWDKAPWVQRWLGPNEPPADTIAHAQQLSAFYQGFAGYAHEHGQKVLGGAFSRGRPDENTLEYYLPMVEATDGLAFHEYGLQDMREPRDLTWHCFRYRRLLQAANDYGLHPDVHITELGLDDGTGWKTKTTAVGFGAQLRWYAQEAARDVVSVQIFAATSYSFTTFLIDESVAQSVQETNRMLPTLRPPEVKTVFELKFPVLVWPVALHGQDVGVITQEFGENPGYYAQFRQPDGTPYHGHNGRDIAVANYSSVDAPALYSPMPGECWPYFDSGYGNALEIWYPNIKDPICKVILAHMLGWPCVAMNEMIDAGRVVGFMGSTGNSTGPHLHYGFKPLRNGFANPGFNKWIDPRFVMEK